MRLLLEWKWHTDLLVLFNDWWWSITYPQLNVLVSKSLSLSFTSPNEDLPPPKMTGLTIIWYSSIKSGCMKVDVISAPANSTRSLSGCCFIFETSSAILSLISLGLFYSTFSNVFEKTILGEFFILGAMLLIADGH